MKKPPPKSSHPLYSLYSYCKQNPLFPWQKDFDGFLEWLHDNDYQKARGDRIQQKWDDERGYLIGIRKAGEPVDYYTVGTAVIDEKPDKEIRMSQMDIARAAFMGFRDSVYKSRGANGAEVATVSLKHIREFLAAIGLSKSQIIKVLGGRDEDDIVTVASNDFTSARMSDSPPSVIYSIWYEIRAMCEDQGHPLFDSVGRMGIRVEWESYDEFTKWAGQEMTDGSPIRAIARYDAFGDFGPDNCLLV